MRNIELLFQSYEMASSITFSKFEIFKIDQNEFT